MSNERLLDKIRKLFALANCEGATENEAKTALRMANKLLDKHSINTIDLADEREVSITFLPLEGRQAWMSTIINGVARLYDCRYFRDMNWDTPKHVLVGTSANRMTASIVIEQLVGQFRRETKGKNNSYKVSAANALYWTCDGILKERKGSTEPVVAGTGLIPLDMIKRAEIDNQDFLDTQIGKLGKSNNSKAAHSAEGAAYGKGLNPGARVSGSSAARLN